MKFARELKVQACRGWRPLAAAALMAAAGLAVAATPAAPVTGDHPATSAHAGPQATPKAKPSRRLDINSASRSELKALPGIGDAEADRIIANRPYLVSTEIVSKAGLPEGVYIALRRQIVAMPKTKPTARSSK